MEWPAQPPAQRHKRSFAEMSQSATLSPSPMNFGDPTSNVFSSHFRRPVSTDNSQSERRRTSHPHNPPIYRSAESMAERSQSRSRLQAQTSVIDLTDDAEDRSTFVRQRDRSHSHRPPQLGRSDAVGIAEFIDLTEDIESDVIITEHRVLPPLGSLARIPPAPQARAESPSLFMPLHHPAPPVPPRELGAFERLFAAPNNMLGALAGAEGFPRPPAAMRNFGNFGGNINDFMGRYGVHLFAHEHLGGIPDRMDYQHNGVLPRKPEHKPPEPAKTGFTRSPTEGDVVICPSCEEEMVHGKDSEEPVMKKNGKAPTKKEREEHPFWVLKECGHVYCNKCYQHRTAPNKSGMNVSFRETSKVSKGKPTKVLACSVDGCVAEVRSKEKWVGIFL